jgi:hypothetical protein
LRPPSESAENRPFTITAMEELQVVTTLAVLQHLIKFVGDFKDSG